MQKRLSSLASERVLNKSGFVNLVSLKLTRCTDSPEQEGCRELIPVLSLPQSFAPQIRLPDVRYYQNALSDSHCPTGVINNVCGLCSGSSNHKKGLGAGMFRVQDEKSYQCAEKNSNTCINTAIVGSCYETGA